ncbi:hypothetical protein AALB64_00110 [Lachnospiraceae bacterium 45-P1]
MADSYDKDAYYCLVIAVLMEVGASKAARIYWDDPKALSHVKGKNLAKRKERSKKKDDIGGIC